MVNPIRTHRRIPFSWRFKARGAFAGSQVGVSLGLAQAKRPSVL